MASVTKGQRRSGETAIGTCLREPKIGSRRLYAGVRDELLDSGKGNYDLWTYCRRLVEITPGSRSAQNLVNYLEGLVQDYEKARKRATCWLWRHPELTGHFLALLYCTKSKEKSRRHLPTL